MNLFELYAKISVDDTGFKKSMENAQKASKNVANAMKELQSPLDKAKSGFNAIAHPVETAKQGFETLKNKAETLLRPIETLKSKVQDSATALETQRNKLSVLASGYDSAKKKVEDLTKEFNKSAAESGTSSKKTQELAEKLKEAESKAANAKKEMDDFAESVSKTGKNSDSATNSVGNFASKLGSGLATAAKIGTAAIGTAVAGITALTTTAVNNYAEYEQLVGGVETLFKQSADVVQQYAANAYKTAGMSANEYMETVTSFSASLLQSLDGDTAAAAEKANLAITDMSDNANKMGTSMEMIQNAYNGFAKQNYTMLDNLKLGYGGTKEEMARLIEDAAKLKGLYGAEAALYANKGVNGDLSIIVDAIHTVQTEMGITGTTAKEAGETISGSISAMKSAWSNLVTGIADDNANIGQLIDNLIDSAVVAAGNLLPRIEKTLTGIGELIDGLAPVVIDALPGLISNVLPSLLDTGLSLLIGIIDGITNNFDSLLETAFQVIDMLLNGIIDNLPRIIEMGVQLIGKLAVGIVQAIPELVMKVPEIISAIVNGFSASFDDIVSIGENIVKGIWDGISAMASWITEKVSGFFSGIVGSAKSVLGIHSPSTVFAGIGGFMAEGLGEGWEDKYGNIKRGIQNDLQFKTATVDFANSGVGMSSAGIINSTASNSYSNSNFPSSIELRLSSSDGQTFGRWLVPFVRSENRSNPEVVSDI